MKKLIVGMTGASGAPYGIDLLQALHQNPDVETHLIISEWAKNNIKEETDYSLAQVMDLADHVYSNRDMGATIASGSFLADGMIIVPTSMKTVAAISSGYDADLIGRAADVTIKEQRKLVLVPRETPLSVIHLENLTRLAKLGVAIVPPMPAFYAHPKTIADLVHHQTMKELDLLGIANQIDSRWEGTHVK
ncbi:3-octaprenyl-4-hydroxybenzoate carboxy-lyase [Lactobacillus selangorensis]|uniref:Flavin prenyltransferase UbiX n=1 Tax=Lactobacillus selangorensis TaxID=81857 RepID=A0A0R2G8K0_9LACO|nr:UbiX family flavin prenyltransferase [Lactobacillus selangorensis]KRN28642.1 3-octaprenyl-4-hydroxybenzoate carboxy-lyase [Lactobacillus selangorensis]KRN32948.1 3-octaprenyl-4-hydroxybenzoate carboxy-lyase [Lactobacillus selangorensis]